MKKTLIAALVLGLVGSLLVTPTAVAKKKKKKPAITQVDQKMFLRRAGCGDADDMTRLSIEDGEDMGCWYVDAGVLYDGVNQFCATSGACEPTIGDEPYPAVDGIPFTLDASKPITGEINLYGGDCAGSVAGVETPCSPVGLSAGQASFRVKVLGTTGGEEKELGVVTDTFVTAPGQAHTTKLEVKVDAALHGAVFDSFSIVVYRGGAAWGPGGIEYDDPASFITIPTLVTK